MEQTVREILERELFQFLIGRLKTELKMSKSIYQEASFNSL